MRHLPLVTVRRIPLEMSMICCLEVFEGKVFSSFTPVANGGMAGQAEGADASLKFRRRVLCNSEERAVLQVEILLC